jgi:hypothetical protein
MPTTLESIDRRTAQAPGGPVAPRIPAPSFALLVERYASWALGVAGALVGALLPHLWLAPAPWSKDLVGNVVAACAIFVAYLLTAATILPAVEEKSIVKKLRSWDYYSFVVDYIARAAWSAGLLLLVSISFAPLSELLLTRPAADRAFSAAWWGLALFAIGAVYTATNILLKMLKAR